MQLILLIPYLIYIHTSNAFYYPSDNNNGFDWKLSKVVLGNECTDYKHCNVVLSPYLTKLALALLKEAIASNTISKQELSILLPGLNQCKERSYWMDTIQSLKDKTNDYYVLMGSLLALSNDACVDPSFKWRVKRMFNTEIKNYNFNQVEKTVKTLNEYVSKKTEGHVKDIVNPELINDATAIILSTIYFKASWKKNFTSTSKEKFVINSSRKLQIETTFMEVDDYFQYRESEIMDSKLIRMNYKGDKYAMYIILPNQADGLQTVIENLNGIVIQGEKLKMKSEKLSLKLPKFKFESSFSLANYLQKLGVRKIFTSKANIKSIKSNGPPIIVKDVLQKMGIEVNESGTEAYGTIAIPVGNRFGGSSDSIPVEVNHPFLCFIEDISLKSILFIGKVVNPNQ